MNQDLHSVSPKFRLRYAATALCLILGSSLFIDGQSNRASVASPSKPVPQRHRTTYTPNHFSKRATMYYHDVWGIDDPFVRSTESGELIRFSYRVLDPQRALQLNDKKAQPTLVDLQAGVSLVIPSLEKVGQLRQSSTPEAGKDYWMAFSNPGRHVKKGDRVEVQIGMFRAQGLVVE